MTMGVTTFLYTLLAILSQVTLAMQFSHAQRLKPFGLEEMRITDFAAVPKYFGSSQQYLSATTDNSGIYRRSISHSDSEWVNLGLQGKTLTALDIYIWGAGPAQFHTPVVGTAPDYSQGDSTLVYRYEKNKWVPVDSGLPRIQAVTALTSFHLLGHEPPGAIFAIGSDLIFKSSTSTRFWTEIYTGGIGPGIVVIEAAQNSSGKEVWAGGFTESYISAFVLKSQNEGKTWEEILLPPASQINNSCNALTFHPTDSAIIYAGVEGAVLKTTNGGQTWNFTGLRDTDISFLTVTLDPVRPDYVYAGGISRQSNIGVLWESFDAGATWQQVSLTQKDTLAGRQRRRCDT